MFLVCSGHFPKIGKTDMSGRSDHINPLLSLRETPFIILFDRRRFATVLADGGVESVSVQGEQPKWAKGVTR
jgi:hypothetical protein